MHFSPVTKRRSHNFCEGAPRHPATLPPRPLFPCVFLFGFNKTFITNSHSGSESFITKMKQCNRGKKKSPARERKRRETAPGEARPAQRPVPPPRPRWRPGLRQFLGAPCGPCRPSPGRSSAEPAGPPLSALALKGHKQAAGTRTRCGSAFVLCTQTYTSHV